MTNSYSQTMSSKLGLALVILLLMFSVDCFAQAPVEVHPQESRMPFADLEAILLKKQSDPSMARMYSRQQVAF